MGGGPCPLILRVWSHLAAPLQIIYGDTAKTAALRGQALLN